MPNLDSTRDVLYALSDLWFRLKNLLEVNFGIHDAVLHFAAGVILQFVFVLLLGLRLSSVRPWMAVCVIQCLNEASDLYWSGLKEGPISESVLDTALTLFFPSVLLIIAKSRSVISGGRRASAG